MATGIAGKRLVVGLYLAIVCFTGVAGYLTAGVVGEITAPRFLFLIEFPATRLGLAAYGALTIAVVLGVLLWLVTVVSERVDDEGETSIEDSVTSSTDTTDNSTGDSDGAAGTTAEDDETPPKDQHEKTDR